MKNYIQPGALVTVTAAAAVLSGAAVKSGFIIGIANNDAAIGEEVVLSRLGVYEVAKVSVQAWTLGAKIYWDDAAKLFTTVTTANTLVGVAHAVAANPSSVGEVLLTGQV